ncbi:MAG: hypothetical protein JWQ90_493 [Hydrocarboniphaga sp.]|uniref:DUF3604 domain-containing protein n=1 Tax=Hydrocarboniphaga sp. TaxID=2033016 RepID=UPI00262FCE65|nr:DUF3604 domain-containing protein [Hydrocarboniphaga sp.]MDB5968043.1 hypothetical protein [Hydrocarboniphaga sp.]
MNRIRSTTLLVALLLAACNKKPAEAPPASTTAQPPAAATDKQAYFGDLHLHTAMSFDAFTMRTNTLPEDSYRFARGDEVDYLGQKVKRKAPLDFLAVTDHSEYLGVLRIAADPNGPFKDTPWPKAFSDIAPGNRMKLIYQIAAPMFAGAAPIAEFRSDELQHSNWQHQIDAAEKYYEPGRLTTFVAYEWSSIPNGANLHRNVIFLGPKYPQTPFSSIDSQHPEDLWTYMDHQREQGVEVLDLPHNSNVSDGLMFDWRDSFGKPISRENAEQRRRNEPLVEISQNKGTSETHPLLSPNDEFADFEMYEILLGGKGKGRLDGSYVRQALGRGFAIEQRIGLNPFQLGFAGASDFHSGVSATEEFNFPGALGLSDSAANAQQLFEPNPAGEPRVVGSASGLTGVWAEGNTREAIFAALKRKEVFATSGGRIRVRLYAGWDFDDKLTAQADWALRAAAAGVPMGGELAPGAKAKAPRIAVQALKDPDSGNLDRIQIVKVWLERGASHEQVFDVAWAGDRRPDTKTGKLPSIGSTVDLATAQYSNSIGATELATVWTDPEFDAAVPAAYYARVLEIPTPRWTTYVSVKNKLPLSDRVPATIQERAWTSPVYYKP